MRITISPSVVSGSIQAPASKSSMQRACAAALISKGRSIIKNPGNSNDCLAAIQVIRDLGAVVENLKDGSLGISSHGVDPVSAFVNCGESGLGIRMFAPLVALSKKQMTIEGEGSLLGRPMNFFDEVFPLLKVDIRSNDGKLPLQLTGPLQPASNITIDGSLSSQFLTGLLMAYSASDAKDCTITVDNLKSRPYIDLTLKVMEDFGLKIPENRNYESFYFGQETAPERTESVEYIVEGDWSGAAFLLVASAIAGRADILGLDPYSTQADKAILKALEKSRGVEAFTFDATDCPDLFPPLVALAASAIGSSYLIGISRLTHKESDRSITLQEEFGKMGVDILLEGDVMEVKGNGIIKAAAVDSRGDHRIAMACAVAALRAEGPVMIDHAEAVNKSYPGFFEDLKSLGASVNELAPTY